MSKREGVGLAPPTAIEIRIYDEDVACLRLYTESIAIKRGYDKNNCLKGGLGEAGLAKYINDQLGIERLCQTACEFSGGDGGVDITAAGIKMQVKTHRPGLECLVTRVSGKESRLLPFRAEIYIFCELLTPLRETAQKVALQGWIRVDDLERFGHIVKRYGKWHTVIDTKYLEPMGRLIALLEVRRFLNDGTD